MYWYREVHLLMFPAVNVMTWLAFNARVLANACRIDSLTMKTTMKTTIKTKLVNHLLFVFLVGSLCISSRVSLAADGAKEAAKGKVLADSGFRPKPNGFSFENWGGNEYPYSNLTSNDLVALFGEQVCARWNGNTCVATPAAKVWLNEINQMMKGGHCEGMAALSAAFQIKQESPGDYGGKQAFDLTPKDRSLMATISTYFATQVLEVGDCEHS